MERFGRYRVTGTLGKGAMGEVHLAVDEVLGREVAVKTLKGGASGLAARLLDERFRQEARAIATLSHPGVVQVFDIDVNADPPYIVMERVLGPSLKERLAERPLSDRELRALGIQIANALAAAHAAGVVHRDVKPANILAAGDGAWKLADFGVAHVPDSSLTMTGQFVGSPAYAPPEALLRGQLGPAGDIYGLGATLYQAIAGRWPRADSTSGALLAPVPPLAQLAPNVSPQIADVIDRAVAMEPESRPSAADFASALARAATQPSATQPAPVVSPTEATEFIASHATPVGPATQFVSSVPGAPAITLSGAPPQKRNWQKYALLGAMLLVIIIIAVTRQSPSPPSNARSANERPPALQPPQPAGPHSIRADQPPLNDRKAAKDWNRIVEKLHEQEFGEARQKLDEFERKHGQSPETRSLAEQLDALPEVYRREED
ncbi:MAG: protein kinase [Myxococcota bacterium]|nr:protein kinase [Myxococcota bacterium]